MLEGIEVIVGKTVIIGEGLEVGIDVSLLEVKEATGVDEFLFLARTMIAPANTRARQIKKIIRYFVRLTECVGVVTTESITGFICWSGERLVLISSISTLCILLSCLAITKYVARTLERF